MYFFSIVNSDPLKKLLESGDPQLEEILDQDSLEQEIQTSNKKLINFLVQQNVFDTIISYVTELPKNLDLDPLEPHRDLKINKYPLRATRVLTAKSEIIANYFLGLLKLDKFMDIECETIPDEEVVEDSLTRPPSIFSDTNTDMNSEIATPLAKFLKFLDKDAPLNPTLAGYFTQILLHYVKSKEDFFSMMLFKEYFFSLEKLTRHVYNDSLEELLEMIFKVDIKFGEDTISSEEYLEKVSRLLNLLIKNINSTSNDDPGNNLLLDLKENSAKILGHVLSKPPANNHELISSVFDQKVIESLYNSLIELQNIGPVSSVLCDLMKFYATTPPVEDSPISHLTESKSQQCLWSEYYFIEETIKNLSLIVKLLNLENKELNPQALSLQSGITCYPFGIGRVKLLEVVLRVIMLKSLKLNVSIADSSLLEVLLMIMIRNPWNNIVHEIILKIVRYIITSESTELIASLFKGARILEVIKKTCLNSSIETKSKSKTVIQAGNVAHLVAMANLIESSENILIEELLLAEAENWNDFSTGFLHETNLRNKVLLYEKEISKQSTPLREFPRTHLPHPNYPVDEDDDMLKPDDTELDPDSYNYKNELLQNYEDEHSSG